ncbi:MAG TPA: protein phosphatase 2C domain-containing protein [Actinophytocola sp.]|uniref:protein phosphatase 2C domain-containing protein n=1 Tax=Actinophytocola sp. TaxID=1872138 RepID=UPI002DDD1914|nr:protein phosphatase 2C domain-containing protein [Actinophytocola sp.]HEV2784263.1 protein phosphatase 2C domain-containing protein [Actinophytocola sp.]
MTELQCPSCAEPVAPADRFCEGCGTDLLVHRTPVGGPAGPIAAPDRECVACGATEIGADGFCERCGRGQPTGRDRMEYDLGVVAGVGDRGRHRSRNEDSMAFARIGPEDDPRAVVAVVCDGVASTERADQASQAAADAAIDVLASAALEDEADLGAATRAAVDAAVAQVSELTSREPPGSSPSCTFVSAAVTPRGVTVGWVGDSRAYWLSSRAPSRRLTLDDTVAAQLVAAGMDADEASRVFHAHALSSWIGADAGDVSPHVVSFQPDGPGAVLLCSDGLWNYLPEADDLAAKLPAGGVRPLTAAAELTGTALELGGHDNITVVVISYPLRSPR